MKFETVIGSTVIALSLASCVNQPPLVTQCRWPMKGDRTQGPALVGHEYGPQTTPIPLNSVQFSSEAAAKLLAVQNLFAVHSAANTTAVTARFVSCSDAPFSIQVRTSFMDANEAPSEPTSAWQTVFLQPHLIATYAENSTSRNASSFLIEIRSE